MARPLNLNSWTAVIPIFLLALVAVVMETKMVDGGIADADLKCTTSEECGAGQICYIESGEWSGFCRGKGKKETSRGAEKNLPSDDNKNDEQSQSAGIETRNGPESTVNETSAENVANAGGGSSFSRPSFTASDGAAIKLPQEEKSAGIPRILIRLLNALEQLGRD